MLCLVVVSWRPLAGKIDFDEVFVTVSSNIYMDWDEFLFDGQFIISGLRLCRRT